MPISFPSPFSAFPAAPQILTRDCVTISVDAVIYWRTSHSDRVICVVDNIKYVN